MHKSCKGEYLSHNLFLSPNITQSHPPPALLSTSPLHSSPHSITRQTFQEKPKKTSGLFFGPKFRRQEGNSKAKDLLPARDHPAASPPPSLSHQQGALSSETSDDLNCCNSI